MIIEVYTKEGSHILDTDIITDAALAALNIRRENLPIPQDYKKLETRIKALEIKAGVVT